MIGPGRIGKRQEITITILTAGEPYLKYLNPLIYAHSKRRPTSRAVIGCRGEIGTGQRSSAARHQRSARA